MTRTHKAIFLAISAVLCASGTLAIVTKQHTGSSRYTGITTSTGADAVWFGQTCFLLAALPLCVLLPKRWVGYAVAIWWVALMAWLFVPMLLR